MARKPPAKKKVRGKKEPPRKGRPRKPVPAVNDERALLVTEMAEAMAAAELSETDRRILAVRLIPESVQWTDKVKAKLADVSERTWYRHRYNPAIQEYVSRICGAIADSQLPEVLHRLNHDATNCLLPEDRARASKVLLPYTSMGMALARNQASKHLELNFFEGGGRVPVDKMTPDQRLVEAAEHLRAAGWTVVPPAALPSPDDDRIAQGNAS